MLSFVDSFENLPSDVNRFAFDGDEVTLLCPLNRSVIWRFSNSTFYDDVYKNREVTGKYKSMARVEEDGSYSLDLSDVTKERSGLYLCMENEGRGTEHGIRLTVRGKSNHLLLLLILITDQSSWSLNIKLI